MILQQIIQQNSELYTSEEVTYEIPNAKELGLYANLVTEKSIWYDGATYITGQNTSADNNSPIIMRYKDGIVEEKLIYSLTNSDPDEHPRPAIFFYNDYLYVVVVNGHGQDILILKSNTIKNISDGFSLHHTIVGQYGYLNVYLTDNNELVILTRSTGSAPNFSHRILISDSADFTTWNEKQITDSEYGTSNVRHYTCIPTHYGTNEWRYFGVQMRYDTGGSGYFYKQCMYKTKDYITFYNLTETFSKDITSGEITQSELLSNCATTTPTDTSKSCAGINGFILNDEVYNLYYNYSSNDWRYQHIDKDGTITETVDNILTYVPGLATLSITLMWFNGRNIVHKLNQDLYVSNLDFTDFRKVGVLDKLKILPSNLPEVEGFYMIGGSNTVDDFYYNITEDRFYN